jgi:glutamate dehydrogenase (NADP+)
MEKSVEKEFKRFMSGLKKRNPAQKEFHQAVHELAQSVMPVYLETSKFRDAQILERLTEPDRIVTFRVCWQDDEGNVRVNRAWRVQFNNALGAYKGGLRFHSSVSVSILKFLGFEQIFKNSLTGLPMGGAKGGSNFNPKGKSDNEVMRFCQNLMLELHRHIGESTDVPAGDIGVGAREISYLFGQYIKLTNRWTGVLTGKTVGYGGSLIRKEATGYGCVYFTEHMLNHGGLSLNGSNVSISGSGNVATYAAEKCMEKGAKVITLSDSSGYVYAKDGINPEQLEFVKELKEVRRGRISELAEQYANIEFYKDKRPWEVPTDVAMPCATQNEIEIEDAKALTKNGVKAVAEGANMPSTIESIHEFHANKVLFAPGKAANAGGVSVSGLEQSQNAMRVNWTAKEVDNKLQEIMEDIHKRCVDNAPKLKDNYVNYVDGANIAGFMKVAKAMLAYGIS